MDRVAHRARSAHMLVATLAVLVMVLGVGPGADATAGVTRAASSPAASTAPEPSATPVPSAAPEPSATPVPSAAPEPATESSEQKIATALAEGRIDRAQ